MTKTQLLLLYISGFTASVYIGMRIEAWRWGKRIEQDIRKAYNRGWNSGKNSNDHILQQRDEFTSSVRILTGEEGYDDESFSGSG